MVLTLVANKKSFQSRQSVWLSLLAIWSSEDHGVIQTLRRHGLPMISKAELRLREMFLQS